MGMYLHIHVNPGLDQDTSMVEVWANYVDPQGKPHPFDVFKDVIPLKEYSEQRAIEQWVTMAMTHVSSAVASAMLGNLARGTLLLIPPAKPE